MNTKLIFLVAHFRSRMRIVSPFIFIFYYGSQNDCDEMKTKFKNTSILVQFTPWCLIRSYKNIYLSELLYHPNAKQSHFLTNDHESRRGNQETEKFTTLFIIIRLAYAHALNTTMHMHPDLLPVVLLKKNILFRLRFTKYFLFALFMQHYGL